MTKSKNYETKRTGTKDGMVSFGHIHPDQVKSSVMSILQLIKLNQENDG